MDIHADHPDFERLAEAGEVVAYFGYGSLANKTTLRTRFLAIRRAEIAGWRRFWLPARRPATALLSVRPDPGHLTQGVVVYDRADHLTLVDEREAGYRRREIPREHVAIDMAPGFDGPIYIYEALRPGETAAQTGSLILQSYLDAVLQGFLSLYGEAGVERFVADTEGFRTAVLKDREAPRYPRSVVLGEGEGALFDRLVTARGAAFVPLE